MLFNDKTGYMHPKKSLFKHAKLLLPTTICLKVFIKNSILYNTAKTPSKKCWKYDHLMVQTNQQRIWPRNEGSCVGEGDGDKQEVATKSGQKELFDFLRANKNWHWILRTLWKKN